MGFGFNLFGFPFIILSTAGLLVYFFISRKKVALFLLGGMWLLCFLIFTVVIISGNFSRPILLTKEKIIGEYRIETKLFPGKNASWQYDHFRFIITKEDSILFFEKKPGSLIEKSFRHKLIYKVGPPDLWTINVDSTHHVIQTSPTLYRSHNRFYYAFHSSKYGNMFFRKVEK